MKKSLLIYTNSLNDKSETFIINHIKYCVNYFQVTVLVNDPTVKIPEALPIEVFSTRLWKGLFHRFSLGINLILSGKLFYLKFINPFKFGRNSLNFSLISIAPFFHNKSFDIIHSHFGNNGLLISQLKKANLIESVLYTQFHGIDFTSKKYHGKYYKDLITSRENIIAVTDFSRRELYKLGFDKEKIILLPVGTDLDFFRKSNNYNETHKIKRIVIIGRLIELKGVKLIPELLKLLKENYDDNFEFLVIGEGSLKRYLLENVKEHNAYFQYLGYRDKWEIRDILQSTDVFVYPGIVDSNGRVENQCVTIQEALAMQVPVVAFNVGGIADSIKNGINGFLIEKGDLKEMSDKIISIFLNIDLKNELGLQGLEIVKQNFSYYKNMKMLLNHYLK